MHVFPHACEHTQPHVHDIAIKDQDAQSSPRKGCDFGGINQLDLRLHSSPSPYWST